jgi:hypothetical protein
MQMTQNRQVLRDAFGHPGLAMKRLLLVITVLTCQYASAQEQPRYFLPVAGEGQMLRGSVATGDGAIGLDSRKAEGGFKVAGVAPGSPAESAGLQVGDVITSADGQSVSNLGQIEFNTFLLRKQPGQTIKLAYLRKNQQMQALVLVDIRGKVYPADTKRPPAVSQFIFDGHALITAAVSQMSSQQQSVMLWLILTNVDASMIPVDDSKFFVLDGEGQQLRQLSLNEVKYSIQAWLAQTWHGGNYPPPSPPPPRHSYVITGTENGNYTFTKMGVIGTVSGSSSGTYTVQEQPDYNQAGYMLGYSIASALRQHADRKHNEQVTQQAQQTLSQWDAVYFRSQSPVIPAENRSGGILYWTGSARQATGPFRVVLFLIDPTSSKQEITQFQFLQ